MLSRLHIEYPDRCLVFAALPHRVGGQAAVVRHIHQSHTRAAVRAHGVGINENLVFALETLAPVDDRLLLVRQSLGEEVAAVAAAG